VDLILRSAKVDRVDGAAGLRRFLDDPEVGNGRRAMVFVPPRPGPWLDRVLAASAGSAGSTGGARVEYMVCVDGVSRDKRRPISDGVRRLLLRDPADKEETTDWAALQSVLKALGQAGPVMIVDRAVGAVYPATQLQR